MPEGSRGIPGLRGTDHIGFNVPDMAAAHEFLVDILGCEHIYDLAGKRADDDWMTRHLGVHPRTEIRDIRFYRLGNGANFEVFVYQSADDDPVRFPRNSDPGGFHLAFYVDDLDRAVDFLRANDVEVMGDPVASAQSATGQRWVYFRAPWGLQFELVSFPEGKAYENGAERVLWHPAHPHR
ncbi:VOC family protein [Enemella evansiae]|uniref:VOC family protein n=1 Tax=Enemella evansiae TaxID=2016499 RepID=UPI000B97448D|nr:VOC family protein [Enemella evansiae]OYO06449.1 glyoxalase [Enemella evansiae]OYO07789.1 glyoxalase [Enemella evansiae]TDO86055.1 glyoxylase I family protein [Enemella evansiae]